MLRCFSLASFMLTLLVELLGKMRVISSELLHSNCSRALSSADLGLHSMRQINLCKISGTRRRCTHGIHPVFLRRFSLRHAPEKFISLWRSVYSRIRSWVRACVDLSLEFITPIGVRQTCIFLVFSLKFRVGIALFSYENKYETDSSHRQFIVLKVFCFLCSCVHLPRYSHFSFAIRRSLLCWVELVVNVSISLHLWNLWR